MLRIFTAAKQGMVASVLLSKINPDEIGGVIVHPLDKGLPNLRDGELALVCGAKAVAVLQGMGIVPKNRKVESLRGEVILVNAGRAAMIVTYDPAITIMDSTKEVQISWDIALAKRWLLTGGVEAVVGKYEYVQDFTDAINFIKKEHATTGKKVAIAVDLETVGLNPYASGVHIVLISVTVQEGKSQAIRFSGVRTQPAYRMGGAVKMYNSSLITQVEFLMSSRMIALRGANFKFDMGWLHHHWGIVNFNAYSMDTTLVGSLLDENRSNSLSNHTKEYVPLMGGYDAYMDSTYDKGRMDLVPSKDLLDYGGGDTDACLRVSNVMKRVITKDRQLINFYTKLLHPAMKAVAKMEQRGMIVNEVEYDVLDAEVRVELKRVSEEALAMIPKAIRNTYANDLKLTRDVILRDFLFSKRGLNMKPVMFTAKNNDPSCAMEHLELLATEYAEVRPFVQLMSEVNSAQKTLTTYITGFRKHLRADGKFHPTYLLHRGDYGGKEAGAVSGRSSAKAPAVQTIPKHTKWSKALRRVYEPPEGHSILIFDYSQGELRIAASLARERTMIAAYQKGIDLHAVTASVLCNMTFEEFMRQPEDWRDDKRYGGKAGNFGLLYGMGWRGFTIYAQKTYGVSLEDPEAQAFRNGFFAKYSGLVDWHSRCKREAHSTMQIRSPLGRIRHLPLVNSRENDVVALCERQAINFGPQSTLSDIGLYAMSKIDREYPDLWMWGFTHDAIAFYVPTDELPIWAVRIRDIMENLPYEQELGWNPPLGFVVDAEASDINWASVKKYKVDSK